MPRLLGVACFLSWAALAVLLWTGTAQSFPERIGVRDDLTEIATNIDRCVTKGTK